MVGSRRVRLRKFESTGCDISKSFLHILSMCFGSILSYLYLYHISNIANRTDISFFQLLGVLPYIFQCWWRTRISPGSDVQAVISSAHTTRGLYVTEKPSIRTTVLWFFMLYNWLIEKWKLVSSWKYFWRPGKQSKFYKTHRAFIQSLTTTA